MRGFLGFLAALALSSTVHAQSFVPSLVAQKSPAPPSGLSTTFGAKTLAGYGGYVFDGLSGALTINSEKKGTCPSSGAASTDLVVNTDYDGVTGQIVPTGTYGNAGPTYNAGGYCLSVTGTPTDGGSATRSLSVTIVANETTVKSQFGFATHPDAGTLSYQLGKVMNSSSSAIVALGDTVVMRNGSGETGIRPALNPINCDLAGSSGFSCVGYHVKPPTGGYAASTGGAWTCLHGVNAGLPCIEITSDAQGTATGQDGFPTGGGAQTGGFVISNANQSSPYADPISFHYVSFVRGHAPTQGLGPQEFLVTDVVGSDGSDAYGWECDYCEVANNITKAASNIWFTQGIELTGAYCDHCYVHGSFLGGFLIRPVRYGGSNTLNNTIVSGVTHTDAQTLDNDFIDLDVNASNPDIEYNFSNNWDVQSLNPVDGDYLIVGSQVYPFSSSYQNVQGTIPLAGVGSVSVVRAACTINGGGTVTITGGAVSSYPCVSGVDYPAVETPDANVSAAVVWASGGGSIQLVLTALTPGTGGNSITLVAGNTTYATCAPAGGVGLNGCITHDTLSGGASSVNAIASMAGGATTAAGSIVSLKFADAIGGSTWVVGGFLVGPNISTPTHITNTNLNAACPASPGCSVLGQANAVSGTVSEAAVGSVTFFEGHADVLQWFNTTYTVTGAGSITGNVFTSTSGTTYLNGDYLVGPNITQLTQITSGVTAGSCSGGCVVTGQASAAAGSIQGTIAAIRPGGINSFNIAVRNNSAPNDNAQQFQLLQQGPAAVAACCVTNLVATNNISNLINEDSILLQNAYNPTVNFNTVLNDAEANMWDPGCTPYIGCTPTEPTFDIIGAQPWALQVFSAWIIPVSPFGGGGGAFVDNLANYYHGDIQTTSSQPSFGLASGTLTQTNNQNVGSNAGLGIWSYPDLFPAQTCNGSLGANPCDGTTVFASYHLMFPTLASGFQTALTSRAATIAAFTPTPGTTFTATTISGSHCMTVVSGTPPAQYTPVNGPGFSAGTVVELVSGGACGAAETVNIKASATISPAQTFATLATNPDGSINGALTYTDSAGHPCWNDGRTNFNQGQTCAAQSLTVAQ